MSLGPVVVFEGVWKKFRRGERHDSLRDLVPDMVRRTFARSDAGNLGELEFWALQDVNFSVDRGEALGVIGPNGAGKSTALKVLTRLLKPTRGRCEVRGRIGALIEVAAGFHPDLTGRENVFLQGTVMGMKRSEIAERFDEIVEFAGVEQFIDTQVKRYSSGMNARLGFSIAAHLRPEVLIIDEVLSVGDMAFQQKCFERMDLFRKKGVAIVLVSHNLQAVSSLCNRAIYLSGSVRAAGKTTDVLEAYVGDSREPSNAAVTSPVRLLESSLVDLLGESRHSFRPGTPVALRVRLSTREVLDDVTFGFLIYRSTDHLLVYDGNVAREDVSAEPIEGSFEAVYRFSCHLVRGHYYVLVHVFHNPTQKFLLAKTQAAVLAIEEAQSWGGVADVSLTLDFSVPAATVEETRPVG